MLETIFTNFLLEQLNDQASGFKASRRKYSDLPDKWIALSLLQKAIRRGDEGQALRAASYLYQMDYRVLWRRLVVIGWEDIGVGNPDLCFMATAAAGSKRWREANGGDWHFAAYLTIAMAQSIKDRSTDDLMMVAQHDPRYKNERESYYDLQFGSLLSIVNDTDINLPHKIIAAWYMAGTQSYGFEGLRRRQGDAERYFQCLDDKLCFEHVCALCRIGVSRSRTVLPAFIPIFWRDYASGNYITFGADGGISKHELRGIPRYVFDGFTRAGKRYLKKIAREHQPLKQFLEEAAPTPERDAIVREMYFRIESSLCDKRLDWSVGNEARLRADEVGFGLTPKAFNAGKVILRQALTELPMTEADL
ncbi:hypothetical protein N9W89_08130 [Hellea sp.]|nr:hypothetical protein [Hellea sp.]